MDYPTDEAIMHAIQGGDLDLLGLLFVRHSGKVFARSLQLVGDRTEADDLVQDSFLRVLRYRDSFQGTARFSTWLYRIVTNVCLDHLKARGREAEGLRELADTPTEGWSGTGPSDRLLATRQALQRLSRDKRELLVRARLRGVGYAELARVAGVSQGAVRVRVHRALRELRSILESLEEGTA